MGLMIDDLYTTPLSISAPPNPSLSHFPSLFPLPPSLFSVLPSPLPPSHSPQSFTCIVESTSGLSTGRDLTVTAMVGDYSQIVGRIKFTQPLDVVAIVASIAGLLVIGMVIFVIVVLAFCYRTRRKKQHACKNT